MTGKETPMATLWTKTIDGTEKTATTRELTKETRRAMRAKLDLNPRVALYEVKAVTVAEENAWGTPSPWAW